MAKWKITIRMFSPGELREASKAISRYLHVVTLVRQAQAGNHTRASEETTLAGRGSSFQHSKVE